MYLEKRASLQAVQNPSSDGGKMGREEWEQLRGAKIPALFK